MSPFVPNALRRENLRRYHTTLARSITKSNAGGAFLHSPSNADVRVRVLYRIYLPDSDKVGGGGALPNVYAIKGRKRTRIGGAACPNPGAIDAAQTIGVTRVPPTDSRTS
jgi:hypothetical protein